MESGGTLPTTRVVLSMLQLLGVQQEVGWSEDVAVFDGALVEAEDGVSIHLAVACDIEVELDLLQVAVEGHVHHHRQKKKLVFLLPCVGELHFAVSKRQ